jgi:TatD DNase family protein
MKIAVQLNLPLVFHVREADDAAFELIKQTVPKDHKFHFHCCTSPLQAMQKILLEFPNAFIGIYIYVY